VPENLHVCDENAEMFAEKVAPRELSGRSLCTARCRFPLMRDVMRALLLITMNAAVPSLRCATQIPMLGSEETVRPNFVAGFMGFVLCLSIPNLKQIRSLHPRDAAKTADEDEVKSSPHAPAFGPGPAIHTV
jgi:hypothetical protein